MKVLLSILFALILHLVLQPLHSQEQAPKPVSKDQELIPWSAVQAQLKASDEPWLSLWSAPA